ncbi:MAG: hypothetical protein LBK29_01445 [Oscillospiraceae bacterium]|jgi:hypothetical protein|nr:hypothetical protein [Oscillospiraceae bacterium]
MKNKITKSLSLILSILCFFPQVTVSQRKNEISNKVSKVKSELSGKIKKKTRLRKKTKKKKGISFHGNFIKFMYSSGFKFYSFSKSAFFLSTSSFLAYIVSWKDVYVFLSAMGFLMCFMSLLIETTNALYVCNLLLRYERYLRFSYGQLNPARFVKIQEGIDWSIPACIQAILKCHKKLISQTEISGSLLVSAWLNWSSRDYSLFRKHGKYDFTFSAITDLKLFRICIYNINTAPDNIETRKQFESFLEAALQLSPGKPLAITSPHMINDESVFFLEPKIPKYSIEYNEITKLKNSLTENDFSLLVSKNGKKIKMEDTKAVRGYEIHTDKFFDNLRKKGTRVVEMLILIEPSKIEGNELNFVLGNNQLNLVRSS